MAELKPCPFCGETPILIESECADGIGYKVKCNNFDCWICPQTSYYSEKSTAFEAWNDRAENPVRHGWWILGCVPPGYFTPGGNRPWICSECEKVISWMLGEPQEKYCPNCGAKMDGGADNAKK